MPNEAEWEYACRAGSEGRFSFSPKWDPSLRAAEEKMLGEYGWFNSNSGGETHPVGQKRPNAWGLYDMHGNAWEWCADFFGQDYYKTSPQSDPTGAASDWSHVTRGGGFKESSGNCRSGYRYGASAGRRAGLGMRVVLEVADVAKDASLAAAGKDAVAALNPVFVKTSSIGGDGGEAFEEENGSAMLIGLRVTTNKRLKHTVVGSIEPIYQSGGSQANGKLHGRPFQHRRIDFLAKPGYAIAGIIAVGSECLDGFRLVYMRVKGRKLDPTDSYESDWFGEPERARETAPGLRRQGGGRHLRPRGLVYRRNRADSTPAEPGTPDGTACPRSGRGPAIVLVGEEDFVEIHRDAHFVLGKIP